MSPVSSPAWRAVGGDAFCPPSWRNSRGPTPQSDLAVSSTACRPKPSAPRALHSVNPEEKLGQNSALTSRSGTGQREDTHLCVSGENVLAEFCFKSAPALCRPFCPVPSTHQTPGTHACTASSGSAQHCLGPFCSCASLVHQPVHPPRGAACMGRSRGLSEHLCQEVTGAALETAIACPAGALGRNALSFKVREERREARDWGGGGWEKILILAHGTRGWGGQDVLSIKAREEAVHVHAHTHAHTHTRAHGA